MTRRVKIATWNVNSLRARHDLVVDWLRRNEPDVLCMQETKVTDDEFPSEELQRLGYTIAASGQKSYNGVAIVARSPMTDVRVGLDGAADDDDKRLLSAMVDGVLVFCAYVPNGKALESPSFREKLEWLARLRATLDARATPDRDVLLCGDFNIAREARDVHDPEAMQGQIHFSDREHQALDDVLAFGLHDALRLHRSEAGLYTWWDYRAGAVRRNAGLRIDYVFITRSLADRCTAVVHDREERRRPKPSDHVPVIAEFAPR